MKEPVVTLKLTPEEAAYLHCRLTRRLESATNAQPMTDMLLAVKIQRQIKAQVNP